MLAWYVYIGNFNSKQIETYNIFNHGGFYNDCVSIASKHRNDKDALADEVYRSLQYYFWSKCEWEVIVSHWPPSDRLKDKKIDVYDQAMLNWQRFIDYLWDNRFELIQGNGDTA